MTDTTGSSVGELLDALREAVAELPRRERARLAWHVRYGALTIAAVAALIIAGIAVGGTEHPVTVAIQAACAVIGVANGFLAILAGRLKDTR